MYPKTMEFDTFKRVEGGSREQLREALSGRGTDLSGGRLSSALNARFPYFLVSAQGKDNSRLGTGSGSVAGHCYSKPGGPPRQELGRLWNLGSQPMISVWSPVLISQLKQSN